MEKTISTYAISSLEEEKVWEDYSRELGNSWQDKSRLVSFIPERASAIAELGCGNGVLLSLLSKFHPHLDIFGVDFNETLLEIAGRQKQLSKVKFIKGNILEPIFNASSLDAVIYCSVLHEVYSREGEVGLRKALEVAFNYLQPGGRLIIRDTLKPPNHKTVKLYFKNSYVKSRFNLFLKDFKMREIKVDYLEKNLIQLDIVDCFEFLFKYFNTVGWQTEMEEMHGYLHLARYKEILEEIGLTIIHQETYLLPFLKKKWNRDFELVGSSATDLWLMC